MFGIPQEFLANWFLSEKELRIWYLRSSYDMQKSVDHDDVRIKPLFYSIHAAVQTINLLSDRKPAQVETVYPDKDFRNFVCYDTIGRIYWIREDHTPEEEEFILKNKEALDHFVSIPITLSDGLDRIVIRSTRDNQTQNEYFVAMEIFPNS